MRMPPRRIVPIAAWMLVFSVALGRARAATLEPVRSSELVRPNIVVILVDDLDLGVLNGAIARNWMPNLGQLAQECVKFERMFVTTSLCSPSRATLLTGQYPHNHSIRTNVPPDGGCGLLDDTNTLATWLTANGYWTGLVGKYLNGYGHDRDAPITSCGNRLYVPPGWNDWRSITSNNTFYDYTLNENGHRVSYGSTPAEYLTDVLAAKAEQFIQTAPAGRPFFLLLAPGAPHFETSGFEKCSTNFRGYTDTKAAPRHEGTASGMSLPRPSNFNEGALGDKPAWLQNRAPNRLTSSEVTCHRTIYRDLVEVMRSVDDMIGTVRQTLIATGQMDDTVILFTSDNGFQRGEHRLLGKKLAYEESIRVPLYVRHPRFATARTEAALVLNNDLAPTIVELTGSVAQRAMDGRSLVPLLEGTEPAQWRKRFLVEHTNEDNSYIPTYTGVHSSPADLVTPDMLYVSYADASQELYALADDPYQMTNVVSRSSRRAQVANLDEWRSLLEICGDGSCQALEEQ